MALSTFTRGVGGMLGPETGPRPAPQLLEALLEESRSHGSEFRLGGFN
jgi:hypothetical protein